jgi:4-amino-4-deoxy-L-arabinose transferase-like glycosyltransferase
LSPDRRTLLALFSIAFGLRVLYAALVGTDPEMNPSPGTYDYYLAERMHDNLHWVGEPFTPRAPAYPVVLASAFRVFGVRQWVAILLQAFIGSATALLLYRIGEKRIARGVGLVSAIWLGLFVHHMHFASVFVPETLSVFALAWFAWALVRPFRRMRQAVWAGFVYTVLIHVDAQFLVLFPVVCAFLLLFATRQRLLNVQYLLLFAAAVTLFTLPWTIRNYTVYGEVVPVGLRAQKYLRPVAALVTHEGGTTDGGADTALITRAHAEGFAANTAAYWRVARFQTTPGDPDRGIREVPAWSLRHNAVNIVNFGLLLPFAALGVILAFLRRHRTVLILTMIVVAHYLTRAFFGAEETSRLVDEPLITLIAVYGASALVRRIRPAAAREPA